MRTSKLCAQLFQRLPLVVRQNREARLRRRRSGSFGDHFAVAQRFHFPFVVLLGWSGSGGVHSRLRRHRATDCSRARRRFAGRGSRDSRSRAAPASSGKSAWCVATTVSDRCDDSEAARRARGLRPASRSFRATSRRWAKVPADPRRPRAPHAADLAEAARAPVTAPSCLTTIACPASRRTTPRSASGAPPWSTKKMRTRVRGRPRSAEPS